MNICKFILFLTSTLLSVEVSQGQPCATADAGSDVTICSGNSATIGTASISGYSYSWFPATGLSNASIAQPIANPISSTTYTLTVTPTNFITNGDFESGYTGYNTDLVVFPNSLPNLNGNYLVTTNAANMLYGQWCNLGDHSGGGNNLMVVDGENNNYSSDHKMWYNTYSVSNNTYYTFSGFVSAASNDATGFTATISGDISGSSSMSYVVNTCGNWLMFSVSWYSGNNSHANLKLTFDSGESNLALDDLYFGICPQTTDEVNVTVNPSSAQITPTGPITYYNQYETANSLVLTSTVSNSYQWYKNGSPIPGATNQAYPINFSQNVSYTDYYYCLTSCGASNTVTFNYIGCDSPSDYPVSVTNNYCASQLPATISQPYPGSSPTYTWSKANPFSCWILGRSSTNSTTLGQSGCSTPATEGIYSKALAANGNEVWMYWVVTVNMACRPGPGAINAEPPVIRKVWTGEETGLVPNPAHIAVTISSKVPLIQIEWYSQLGAKVKSIPVSNNTLLTVDITDLRPGMYVVKLISDNGTEARKLVVQ